MRLQRPKRPQEAINHVASQRANGKPAEVAVSPPEVRLVHLRRFDMLFDGAQQPVSLAPVAVSDSGSRLLGCRYKQGMVRPRGSAGLACYSGARSADMAAVRRLDAQYSADGLDRDLGWLVHWAPAMCGTSIYGQTA
ncbi:hypothetical protein ACHAPX_008407 [Trichoderma viride]